MLSRDPTYSSIKMIRKSKKNGSKIKHCNVLI